MDQQIPLEQPRSLHRHPKCNPRNRNDSNTDQKLLPVCSGLKDVDDGMLEHIFSPTGDHGALTAVVPHGRAPPPPRYYEAPPPAPRPYYEPPQLPRYYEAPRDRDSRSFDDRRRYEDDRHRPEEHRRYDERRYDEHRRYENEHRRDPRPTDRRSPPRYH
ncbi:hypothetical protein PAPYR_13430 [Paratrimastix pyriformis]|uniref:Uncharacterized protein n=1 Tax=Paratrimastix pyriformis TaxID=342808 RepID=A0ABQ8U084_9EUKA|nr:hypothetical protein PAPYR_13430 [Paratrimastix pyriformis]